MGAKIDQIIQIYSLVWENYFDRSNLAYRASLAGHYQPDHYFKDLATTSKEMTEAWKASWDAAYPEPAAIEIEVKLGQASVVEVHDIVFGGVLPITCGPFKLTGHPDIAINATLTTDTKQLIIAVPSLAGAVVTGATPYKAKVEAGTSWEQKLRLHVLA